MKLNNTKLNLRHLVQTKLNRIIQFVTKLNSWPWSMTNLNYGVIGGEGWPLSWGENAVFWENIYGGILKQGSHTDKQLAWF